MLGTMKIYNTNGVSETTQDGKLKLNDSNYLKIIYQVGNYYKELPVGDSIALKHEIANTPTVLSNMRRLGRGGYYTVFEYKDGVSEIVTTGEELYSSMNIGKAITIVNMNDNKFLRAKVEAHGGLSRILINVMYNTKAKYEDKFFKVSQDWVCQYEICF